VKGIAKNFLIDIWQIFALFGVQTSLSRRLLRLTNGTRYNSWFNCALSLHLVVMTTKVRFDGKRSFKAATFFFAVLLSTSASLSFIKGALAAMPTATIGNGNVVKLEVAASPQEIQRGLMYRTSIPEDNGMVFLFHPEKSVNFWMYHTLISLDMCFIRNGKIVKLCQDVPPCKSENKEECPLYPAGGEIVVSEVIELKGGYARRHGIKEGDSVSFAVPGQ
jgi:uncharacterized membrane protein (UPF0127 family)